MVWEVACWACRPILDADWNLRSFKPSFLSLFCYAQAMPFLLSRWPLLRSHGSPYGEIPAVLPCQEVQNHDDHDEDELAETWRPSDGRQPKPHSNRTQHLRNPDSLSLDRMESHKPPPIHRAWKFPTQLRWPPREYGFYGVRSTPRWAVQQHHCLFRGREVHEQVELLARAACRGVRHSGQDWVSREAIVV